MTPADPRRAEVARLASEGVSQREIVRRTGVPRTTVRRWLASTATAPTPSLAPTARPHAPELRALDMARTAANDAAAAADAALADHDPTAATRATRVLARAESTIQRLSAEHVDGLALTPAEWRDVAASARSKIWGMLSDAIANAGPLHCARCARPLHAFESPAAAEASEAAPVTPTKPDAIAPRTIESFARAKTIADISATAGNNRARARALTSMADAAATTARAELATRKQHDRVAIPQSEIEHARKAMSDRVAALASDLRRTGGLCCAACSREARSAIARGE